MKERKKPQDRHREILTAAIVASRNGGYNRITRGDIAAIVNCDISLISHYFGTMQHMRRAIMGEAIRIKDLEIISQGLLAKDPRALKCDLVLRQAAHEYLTNKTRPA